jgi:hypothetical protein
MDSEASGKTDLRSVLKTNRAARDAREWALVVTMQPLQKLCRRLPARVLRNIAWQ